MKKEVVICGLIALGLLLSATSVSSQIVKKQKSGSRDLGDLQFMWGVEAQTGDFQSIGCGCDGQYFYVTGGNNGADPNKVYIFDFDGNYVDSFDQSGTTGWGWLDLAWDGDYFYGGPEAGSRIDVFTPDGTVVDQIPGPVPWCAGVAYDSATDHLWTIDKWTDQVLYEIDMDGNVIKSWSQDKNVYGLAWDDVSSGGPFIWVAVQDPQCTFYQFDPEVGDYTGVYFEAENPGSTDNKACGLDFTTQYNTSAGILFGIQQCDQTPDGVGDQLAGYLICEIGEPVPALCCQGALSWSNVKPGATVNGEFEVSNCGEDDSELNWEVLEWPDWGTNWTFTPSSGTGLTPAMGWFTVYVEATAPSDQETEFTGIIKMINSDDPSDFCEINVYLKTPRSRSLHVQLLERFFERFPNAFPLLRYILGL